MGCLQMRSRRGPGRHPGLLRDRVMGQAARGSDCRNRLGLSRCIPADGQACHRADEPSAKHETAERQDRSPPLRRIIDRLRGFRPSGEDLLDKRLSTRLFSPEGRRKTRRRVCLSRRFVH